MKICFRVILLIIAICMPLVLLGACTSDSVAEGDTLDELLTHVYDLKELDGFIKNKNSKDAYIPGFERILFYNELNSHFPVEVMRYTESFPYTVYKVSQGGYYYVFWSLAYPQEKTEEITDKADAFKNKEYVCVYFSAYVGANKSRLDFISLKTGTSTAKDVKQIDPYFDYVSLSQGNISSSLLNRNKVLEIKYSYSYKDNTGFNNDDSYYDSRIVEKIEVVPIEQSASCYRLIWKQDFP